MYEGLTMNFLKKITSSVAKTPAKTQVAPEILVMQKGVQSALKQSLDDVSKGLPEIAKNQANAMQGLEQLAQNIKATIK